MRQRFSRAHVLRSVIGAAAVCGLALPASALAGDATFRVVGTISVPTPQSLAITDVNGDGIQDLAVANVGDDSVSSLVGSGSGTFTPMPTRSVGGAPHSVAVGDFNGDGFQDLATADFNTKTVTLLTGTGSGAFPLAGALSTGVNPESLALGDFNADGIEDLAVANESSKTVSVFLGTGTGAFDPASTPAVGAYPESLVVGEFNGDGIPDLATANGSDKTVSVLIGSGSGTFVAAASPKVGGSPRGLALGDFNGDGIQDLAVTNRSDDSVTVLIGSGSGTFTTASTPATGKFPTSVAVGDFNGDGIQDLATANRNAASVSVLIGNGSGAFTAAPSPSVGAGPEAVVVGDLNGDGVEDLATANRDAKTVSVLFGNGRPRDAGNVLANRGAEGAGAAGTATTTPEFAGWARTLGLPTFVRYSTPGFPSLIDAARWGGGTGLFTGGVGPSAAAEQTVSVADRAASIDAGVATARLSGLLGGYRATADTASVHAEFLAAAEQPVGTALAIGPVTAADRHNQTVLLRRSALGRLPVGTRAIRVTMRMTRADGTYDDGYLDDVSLVLDTPAPPTAVASSQAVLTRFRMSPRRFHVARPRRPASAPRNPAGTTFRFTLSADARVRIAIARLRAGRRRPDGRCVAVSRLRPVRRCLRATGVGALSIAARGGVVTTPFSGRLRGRRLPPGRYRATITATAGGLRSRPRALTFSITP